MTRIEKALRDAIGFVPDLECAELADALGVAHEECGCSEKECSECCGRIAAAIAARLMPEGMEWPKIGGRPVLFGDEVSCLEYGGRASEVSEFCFQKRRTMLGVFYDRTNGTTQFTPVDRCEPSDTQERIEADVRKSACEYFGFEGEECGGCPAIEKEDCLATMVLDLLRRQRDLCEKGAAR